MLCPLFLCMSIWRIDKALPPGCKKGKEPMSRPVHFEIQASDPQRAIKFYRDVFGWEIKEYVVPGVQIKEEDRYFLITSGPDTEPGINGAIQYRQGPAPVEGQAVNAYVCTMGVANLDETLNKVLKAGGSIALPKTPVQGIGWLAYCKDTEGNIFGMLQSDESAR